MLTQRRWRIAGGVFLAFSGGMAYFGVGLAAHASRTIFFVYWGTFLLAFILAIYCAILDLAYLRLQLKAEERDLYCETLGDEAFRRALREAQEEEAANRKRSGSS